MQHTKEELFILKLKNYRLDCVQPRASRTKFYDVSNDETGFSGQVPVPGVAIRTLKPRLFFLLVGISGCLAVITPLRAQAAPGFATARTFDAGPNPGIAAVGDFNGDGKPDMATLRSVLLGNGDGTFQSPITHNVGSSAVSLAIGDFNADGRSDLAVLGYFPTRPGSVFVLLGKGDGSFETSSTNSVGINPISVAFGDFNGDGKSDLVVANGLGFNAISVLLGKGDGTFQDAVSFNYPSAGSPTFVTVSDFNGDGKPDLAITDTGSAPNNYSGASVSVLLGNGDGTFQSAVGYGVGRNPGFVKTGDFNDDGKVDLAVANILSDNTSVLLGNGDGTFRIAVNYSTGPMPFSLAIGDFSSDGKPDLAVGSQDGVVSILMGRGDGTFQDAVFYNSGNVGTVYNLFTGKADSVVNAGSVVVGDFNGDGKLDVATPGSIIFGNGDGTFEAAPSYSVGSNPYSVAVGDFNGDGQPDLATLRSVLLGNGDGTFQSPITNNGGSSAVSLALGEFNGDNKPDLVVANSANVSVLLGQGDGTFLPGVNYSAGTNAWFVSVGDFDGDDKPDLAVANAGSANSNFTDGSLSLLLGNGDGTFRSVDRSIPLREPDSVAAGDFNGDGKSDLAVTGFTDSVSVLLGNGDGTFANAVEYKTGLGAQSVAVGDFNGDNKPDIAVYNDGAGPVGSVAVLLSNGDGTFKPAVSAYFPTSRKLYGLSSIGSLALADFDGDGKLDVTVGDSGGTVSLLLGNGDGTLQPALNLGVGGGAGSVAVGDFNGDGKPDIVVANIHSRYVTLLMNASAPSSVRLATVRRSDTFSISWPLQSTGFVLESTTSLSLTNWQPAVETLTTNNGWLEVTAPLDQSQRFFRLRKL